MKELKKAMKNFYYKRIYFLCNKKNKVDIKNSVCSERRKNKQRIKQGE